MNILALIKSVFSLDMVIYLAILFVFLAAMVRCVMPLSGLAARLRRASRTIVSESKHNKEKKSWNDLHFLGDKMQGMWTDFLQNAEMRDAHGGSCDVSQYINDETVIYAQSGARLADLTPGLLTSLGILGTFLGLVMGLSGLTLSAEDTSTLLAGMEKLIGGMSTAFLTSIAGVAASIIFNLIYNHHISKCQKAIDRFCDVFSLYAMPKPVSEETALIALQQEQTNYIRAAAEEMGQMLAGQMEQSIMRAMLPLQRSMDNFVIAATQAQVDGMDRVAQLFVQRMNVALGSEFEHLRQVLAETGVEQQKTQQEMRAAMEAIARMTQDVVNMHQLSQGVLEHFKAYVQDMDASRERTDSLHSESVNMLAAMSKTNEQQAAYLSKMKEFQDLLTVNQQQYTGWTDRFLQNAQEQTRITGREMERVVEQMHEATHMLGDAYGQFTRQSQENMARTAAIFDESITASIRQLNDTLASIREETRMLPQLMGTSRDRYAEQVDQFVTALVRLQKSMDRASEAADRAAGKE